jgi:GTP-binding protein
MEFYGEGTETMERKDLRNIAIIAHVDHGKTTLVDEMLKQSGVFRDNQVVAERVMDSGDIERERGITILSKNASTVYNDVKINIVDTPGHADFGGEVERVLKMVNGVLLLVDAAEGPMPQTRFVLQKALDQNLSIVIVVNKIDRPDARIKEVIDEILLLLMDMGATDEQLDSPMVFCSGRAGTASYSPDAPGTDLKPLFDTIIEYVKPPVGDPNAPLQCLVSSIDYNEFVGRTAIGRIDAGTMKVGQAITVCDWHNPDLSKNARITALYAFDGVGRKDIESGSAGDIVMFSGIEDVTIGNTICEAGVPNPVNFVKITDPTVEMTFSVNDSPFAGREGKFVTSRQIRDRLYKELLRDVALQVEDSATTDSFRVMGRGEMHLSILIEKMRREGYEFQVSPPKVLYHTDESGKKLEPYELVVIDLPSEYQGAVIERLSARKGELVQMHPQGDTRMRLEFRIPSRGLFGYRSEFLSSTRGEGILNTIFDGYDDFKGVLPTRATGSLISFETGTAVTYGLYNAQERGVLFLGAGEDVYEGMVVGANPKGDDMAVNVCKTKHLTNTRASGSDDSLRLIPPRRFSLEEALEFLAPDELLEVTPKNFRIRKQILKNDLRMKSMKGKK